MNRNTKIALGSLLGVCAIVVGPVAVRQASAGQPREYRQTRLEDLEYTEVSFTNEAQGLELAGMLFVPEGEGPFPGVVIIHGSGTSRRGNSYYLTLTSHLQQNGIAVLLPDKRGSEKSKGEWRTSSLQDLATDTLAAVDFMRTQDMVDLSSLGIVGESQGGWIAPIAASQSPDVDFVVNLVGAAVTTDEQLAYEENLNLQIMGILPGISNVLSRASIFVLQNVTNKDYWDAVGNVDPLPYWHRVNVPVLVLYGSADTNVPSAESKRRLEALDKENIRVVMYEGSGHGLEDPPGTGIEPIRREAVTQLVDFIHSMTKPAG